MALSCDFRKVHAMKSETKEELLSRATRHFANASVLEIPHNIIVWTTCRPPLPNHDKPYSFLERMTAEIRNAIHCHFVQAKAPLRITESLPSAIDVHGRTMIMRRKEQCKRLAITVVNKQVSEEILPIIYEKNTFEFSKASALSGFLTMIGPNAAYLRRITLPSALGCKLNLTVPQLGGLTLAMKLTKLTINHEGVYLHALSDKARIHVNDFIGQIARFLRAHHCAAFKDTTPLITNVVEVADLGTCGGCDRILRDCTRDRPACRKGRTPETRAAHLKKVLEAIKARIERELGMCVPV